MSKFILASALALAFAAYAPAYVYQYDDGVSDDSLTTSGPATFNCQFTMQFVAVAGATTIDGIDVVWGSHMNPNLPNGLIADVLLMNDPNGDGNPADATILQQVTTTTTNVGTDTFNHYAITPTNLAVGQSFFLSAFIHDAPTGSTWVAMDRNATGHTTNCWWNVVNSSPLGPENSLSLFQYPDYSFMLRATTPVPEPATLTALGIGALALVRRRRQRR